jgi:hypothetical protein
MRNFDTDVTTAEDAQSISVIDTSPQSAIAVVPIRPIEVAATTPSNVFFISVSSLNFSTFASSRDALHAHCYP